MGNKETNKNKKNKNADIDEEYYDLYLQLIKNSNLKIDSTKIKNNLKKYKSNEEFIVLIESGSLAPPHKMHIGLMEITKKYIEDNYKTRKVIGGFLIPSSDDYVRYKLKEDFIPLEHRVNMTKLLIKNSNWLECLDWGLAYGEEIKECLQIIINKQFPKNKIKCVLVFGIDYYLRNRIQLKDEHICIFRPGYDFDKVKKLYPENLIFVEGKDEDINSTSIRKAIRENDEKIINELTFKEIVDYIKSNDIFKSDK
jgi:nicotinic acid mononucleotide adenylyltransferase